MLDVFFFFFSSFREGHFFGWGAQHTSGVSKVCEVSGEGGIQLSGK